jgi:hypothetical protein
MDDGREERAMRNSEIHQGSTEMLEPAAQAPDRMGTVLDVQRLCDELREMKRTVEAVARLFTADKRHVH